MIRGITAIVALLIVASTPALAEVPLFGEPCELKTGFANAASFAELIENESNAIAEECALIERGSFNIVADTKGASSIKTYDQRVAEICYDDPQSLICNYVYRSHWQATCCARMIGK